VSPVAGPLLLVSKSVRALLPYWHRPLGQLVTPRMRTGLDVTEACGIPWAADNDCYAGFDQDRYLDMLEAVTYRSGCLFVVAPTWSPTPAPRCGGSTTGSRCCG
jgi:hypothetical protein